MASTGTIGHLIQERGFGFTRDEKGSEIFFYAPAVEGAAFHALQEGQQVIVERERDLRRCGDRAAPVKT